MYEKDLQLLAQFYQINNLILKDFQFQKCKKILPSDIKNILNKADLIRPLGQIL